jgi:hypothetical protein
MRPYLLHCMVVFISALTLAQQPGPQFFGPCLLGCGPYVPLVTTPMISLQQYSPNPIGASNATTGLVAGATNGTVSQISGSTDSVYSVPVWYRGGAPLTAPGVNLFPEPIAREGHRHMMLAEHGEHHPQEEARAEWMYFSGSEYTANAESAAAVAKGGKKASRSYTNADVERQNQNNGNVKYDSKTEKLQ